MSLKDFNQYMRKAIVAPYPVEPTENQSTLEAIFTWPLDMIDRNDGIDEERCKLFVTLYDSDTSVTSALYQAFYNQSQVAVTDKTIPSHIKHIFPKFNTKKAKKNKKPKLSPREAEEEEDFELKPKRKNRSLLSSIGGRKKEKNELKDTVKQHVLHESGSFETVDCIIVPCTINGELAISNSPETTQFMDTYVKNKKIKT